MRVDKKTLGNRVSVWLTTAIADGEGKVTERSCREERNDLGVE